MGENAMGKAYLALEDLHDQNRYNPLSESDELEVYQKKHPNAPTLDQSVLKDELPPATQFSAQYSLITPEEVQSTISKLKKHKSPGPSGLGPYHLKYIAQQHPAFLTELAKMFNTLTNRPELTCEIRALYNQRIVFIPKKGEQSARPIAIGETILIIFHKLLARKLYSDIVPKLHEC